MNFIKQLDHPPSIRLMSYCCSNYHASCSSCDSVHGFTLCRSGQSQRADRYKQQGPCEDEVGHSGLLLRIREVSQESVLGGLWGTWVEGYPLFQSGLLDCPTQAFTRSMGLLWGPGSDESSYFCRILTFWQSVPGASRRRVGLRCCVLQRSSGDMESISFT